MSETSPQSATPSAVVAGNFPAPYDSSSGYTPAISSLPVVTTVTNIADRITLWKKLARKSVTGKAARPLDTVNDQDEGGAVGLTLNVDSAYTGSTWSANGIYDAIDGAATDSNPNFVDMLDPYNNAIGVLYAPTTHVLSKGCIEYGTQYDSNGSGFENPTEARFFYADWCRYNSQTKALPMMYTAIDAAFWNKYVRTYSNGNGYPEYIAEAYLETNGTWLMTLYNNNTGQYDSLSPTVQPGTDIYSPADDGSGWALFETHYNAGVECAQTPTLSESGIRVQTGDGTWGYSGATNDSPIAVDPSNYQPECFQQESYPYYSIRINSEDEGFWVDSDSDPTVDYKSNATGGGAPSGSAPCNPDSDDYCTVADASANTGVGCTFTYQNPHGVTETESEENTKTPYDTYHGTAIVGNDYKTITWASKCASETTKWTPQEPKVQYNDSSLP